MNESIKRWLSLCLVVAAVTFTVGACSSSTTTSSTISPTTVTTATTESFSGSLVQNGADVYPFTVKQDGSSLLVGFTSITPASDTLGVGIGAWDATTATCGLNQSQNDAAKAGNTALSGTASLGNYCARVYDTGNLPDGQTVTFTLQVQHY